MPFRKDLKSFTKRKESKTNQVKKVEAFPRKKNRKENQLIKMIKRIEKRGRNQTMRNTPKLLTGKRPRKRKKGRRQMKTQSRTSLLTPKVALSTKIS